MLDLQKYINGFENGWFSTKHPTGDGGSFSNCDSTSTTLTEMSLETVKFLRNYEPFMLYCNPCQPLINLMELYEVETIKSKDEERITKRMMKYSKIIEREFGIKVVTDKKIPQLMWFAVWGDKKEECYGSRGDYKKFND